MGVTRAPVDAGDGERAVGGAHPDRDTVDEVKEELADVLAFAFLMAEKYGFDVKQIILEKMEKNAVKYPVSKSKGIAKKYTEL